MKQLLIVDSNASAPSGSVTDLASSTLQNGAVGIIDFATNAFITDTPTKNFAIAYGRGDRSPAIVIPEVDVKTLTANIAEPVQGSMWSGVITIPTTADGNTYTLVLVKKGTAPHERNTWTATETVFDATKVNAAALAAKLGAYFQRMADAGGLDISVSVVSTTITITATNPKEDWVLKAGDDLFGTSVTNNAKTDAIGDKAYVEKLAQECAAGKGFTDTYRDGDTVYPGYPETVEDTDYTILTLRFAVGRAASKTRDERVYQLVHIAIPEDYAGADDLTGMFEPFTPDYVEDEGEGGNG